ncbi:hypothetical protein BOX15_Mlig017026g1 [Macrostomum lignano]|uniref:C-type lectin domain-containing protein n=1 Tax=Macrostomum lignano TaxID=282301 RepID=A0A267EGF2_9PLAT|nr:hypothetical protein BOX15_Mlig017026g1 [Macrostomum lignano]
MLEKLATAAQRLLLPLLLTLMLASDPTDAVVTSAPGQMSLCTGSSRYQCIQSCYDKGMRLVTIKDLATNNRVKAFLLGKKVEKAYVGMDDQAREGYFQRTDGSVYVKDDFSRWASASGGPEQPNEGDDCVTFDSDGNWRVESCILNLPSVCEGETKQSSVAIPISSYSLPPDCSASPSDCKGRTTPLFR